VEIASRPLLQGVQDGTLISVCADQKNRGTGASGTYALDKVSAFPVCRVEADHAGIGLLLPHGLS
jgi:hypothetical protein